MLLRRKRGSRLCGAVCFRVAYGPQAMAVSINPSAPGSGGTPLAGSGRNGRMRVFRRQRHDPSSAPSGHLLPEGEGNLAPPYLDSIVCPSILTAPKPGR